MKKAICVFSSILFLWIFSSEIEEAFILFNQRYALPNQAASLKQAEEAVGIMEDNIEEIEKDDSLFFQYVIAKDYCLANCAKYNKQRKSDYAELLGRINEANKKKNSCYYDYSLSILYGRLGETANILDAVKSNIPNNIKKYAEKVIEQDSSLDNHGAYLILGRLHAMTPKIIYLTHWVSLKKSEEYLKKYIKFNPETVIGRLYLAETYRMMKNIEKHDSLIQILKESLPESKRFYEDKSIIDSLNFIDF